MRAAIAIVIAMCATAHAQAFDVAAVADGTNIATVTTGVEHGLVVGGGYERGLSLAGRPILVGGDAALSAADMDPHDFRVRAGVLVPILGHARWRWSAGADAVVRGTSDDIARMIDIGFDAQTLAGYYPGGWFVAAEVGLDWALATHIAPTDDYRMLVYAGAREGWYHNTGGLIRAGAQAGIGFGRNDLTLRAGAVRDTSGDAPMIPFYATLGYDRRW
jgi:hypothetical protein